MRRKKIMLVFGTRPEAIKMAPLVKAFESNDCFETNVCVTGQHRKMLDQVLDLFDIHPQFDLRIMKQGQDLYDITSRILLGMRNVLKEYRPDLLLVHGDTTTSSAAALAAFYQQIPVAHIEAGLRTYNIYSPWPEEMNRQITGRIATFHFAPTKLSRQNLLKENIKENNIVITGNTVIDALHLAMGRIKANIHLQNQLTKDLKKDGYDIKRLEKKRKLILITGHRRENIGDGFIGIFHALKELSKKYKDIDFIYPMHPNPIVRQSIHDVFGKDLSTYENFFCIEPLDYVHFVFLMEKSTIILTDSGGIQEEAPSLGIPVLVMRDTTERPEAVEAGTVKLVGTSSCKIMETVSHLLDDDYTYYKMKKAINPYGNGMACKIIIDFLKKQFNLE